MCVCWHVLLVFFCLPSFETHLTEATSKNVVDSLFQCLNFPAASNVPPTKPLLTRETSKLRVEQLSHKLKFWNSLPSACIQAGLPGMVWRCLCWLAARFFYCSSHYRPSQVSNSNLLAQSNRLAHSDRSCTTRKGVLSSGTCSSSSSS